MVVRTNTSLKQKLIGTEIMSAFLNNWTYKKHEETSRLGPSPGSKFDREHTTIV